MTMWHQLLARSHRALKCFEWLSHYCSQLQSNKTGAIGSISTHSHLLRQEKSQRQCF